MNRCYPTPEADIRSLVDAQAQADPKLKSSFLYARISARAVPKALVSEAGYCESELPSRDENRRDSQSFRVSPQKTQKTKPLKKIAQTDAIFQNVFQQNQASDENPKSLRVSIDTKAQVKIGNLSRGIGNKLERSRFCQYPFVHKYNWIIMIIALGDYH